jgi:hypothetical protein
MKFNLLYIFSFILITILVDGCNSANKTTNMDIANVKSLSVYDIDPKEVADYSNRLSNVSSYQLKHEEVQLLFANTKEESTSIWKGSFLGIVGCKDGTKFHLAISYYGGFIHVLETGQKIRFVGASGVEWDRIQNAVLRDIFIPARHLNQNNNAK